MPVKHDTTTAIEADHVSMIYGQHVALDHVSFAIPEGEYVGIIGPNGGGKTTMLRILLGLQKPTSGSVMIFGETPLQARQAGKIGYVPQRIAQSDMPFPATVEEIVRTGRIAHAGVGRRLGAADHAAVDRALEITGIADLRRRLIGTLSGGERQKAFIARALASDPRLLVLDEPTTGVDVASQAQFYALLKKLNTELHLTILFVSHDVEVIAKEVSFILALNQKLLCHCEAHDFLSDETLHRLYGDDVELFHQHHH